MIYLLRHGATRYNLEGRFLGQTDIGLSAEGRATFEAIAVHLKQKSFAAIYCSGYQRAKESAQILASELNLPVFVCEDLEERHLGVLDGLKKNHPIGVAYCAKLMTLDYAPPGGERGEACLDRFAKTINRIAASIAGDILVIAHGGVSALYARNRLNVPQDSAFLEHAHYHLLSVADDGAVRGERFNQSFLEHIGEINVN